MVSPRNSLMSSKRTVTIRMAGPVLYVPGAGNTWTFRNVRNVRRIKSIKHDPAAVIIGGDIWYMPLVIANDGQGNTRVVQMFLWTSGAAWAEAGGVDLSAVNYIVTLELAEGV